MKFRYSHLFFIFLILVLVNSCQKDENTNPEDVRTQYNGDWHCIENSTVLGTSNYNVTISNDPSNSSQVLISNFYHTGVNEYTSAVASQSTLVIPVQTVSSLKITSGTGTLVNKDKISWKYSINIGGDIDQVTATYTRL